MKLILCAHCQDVVRLINELRHCQCGKCWGRYIDEINVEVSNNSVVLGFSNSSLMEAVNNPLRNPNGPGKVFTAFIIPDGCATVSKKLKER